METGWQRGRVVALKGGSPLEFMGLPYFQGSVALLCAVLFLQSTKPSQAAERQTLAGHVPEAVTASHLQPMGRLLESTNLHLVIGLPLQNKGALTNLLQQLYDPSSPNYHHYLTPAQFTASFGPSNQDYQALINFAKTNGLEIVGTHGNRVLLDVSGNVSAIEKAFHVTLRTYQHPTEGRQFFAPDVEPSVDTSVPILHVNGLDNYAIPRPALHMGSATGNAIPASGSAPSGNFRGNDFKTAYAPNVTLNGYNQMVGLVEFDGYYTNDIATYEHQAGLPQVPLTNVLLDGFSGVPSGVTNSVAEVSLDIEMVISMATNLAKVVVFEGSFDVYNDILNSMAANNQIKQFSSSWFLTSYGQVDPTANQIYQEMIAQGQSFFQASGDANAWCGANWWPADNPYITIVGGTTLAMHGSGASYSSETVWNLGYDPPGWYGLSGDYVGSGGGVSSYYSIPTWQQGVNLTAAGGSTTMRNYPDVAMNANNVWVIFFNNQSGSFWGTSCAAPLWAGFTALVNQQATAKGLPSVGFLNPAVYAIGRGSAYGSCFHDITTGNNTNSCSTTGYFATPGYDLCTGWGSPMGSNLINALVLDPVYVTVQSTPSIGGTISGGGTYNLGTNVMVCASANASCYSFANWTLNSNVVSTSACYTFTASNATLVANFTPLAYYTIATSSSPVGEGSTSGGCTVPCGSNVTVCASPIPCYSFVNWTDQNSNVLSTVACYSFIPSGNATLVANFAQVFSYSYTINTSSSPPGGGSTSGGGTVACGSTVTVCATANSCYSFVNWTDQNSNVVSDSACSTFAVTSNETLVANFAPIVSTTINTSSSPPAAGSTSGGWIVACGSTVTVCATANPCYNFVNWTDQNSNVVSASACYSFTVVNNESLVANFAFNNDGPTSGSLRSLWLFTGGSDGVNPFAGLVQGSDCNFYGTAFYGGTYTVGTVFQISPSGTYTSLYSFGSSPTDGAGPNAGLVQGSDGNFYGTTQNGGNGPCFGGCGTVFRISASGNYTSLYSFVGYPNDGANPYAGLMQGSDGNFYGTAVDGGANNFGTVFRISPSGTYTSLYSFGSSPADGENSFAGLVQASDGNLYGTTYFGGTSTNCYGGGCGTVFQISPSGSYTSLYSFGSSPTDGAGPNAGLVQSGDGNFYGTTLYGGTYGDGTVFRISPVGSLIIIWSFTGCRDGANPYAPLVQGSDGNFYGTTQNGGTYGVGTAFRITPGGSLTIIWSFTGGSDGANPLAPLVQGSDGNLYGTAVDGGANNGGSVFTLTVPLNPPANQISRIQFFDVFDSTDVAVLIPSVAGETYRLQYTDSLCPTNWLDAGGTITSIGGPLILPDFAESLPPQRFYRAVITP
jgi:uncharacterized repeat protein (TIGR03803 family)